MRPSVDEQLLGTCRVLEKVVAPCVADPFARTILDGLVANLRMLTGAMPALPGFLRDDNAATLKLLATLRAALPESLAARVDSAARAEEPDVADGVALEARNQALRALLAEAVCEPALDAGQHAAIVAHMSARAARAPMRYVPTAPAKPANAKT